MFNITVYLAIESCFENIHSKCGIGVKILNFTFDYIIKNLLNQNIVVDWKHIIGCRTWFIQNRYS